MENRYYFRAKRIDNDEWVHGLPSCNTMRWKKRSDEE